MKRYLRFLLILFAVFSSAYCYADLFSIPSGIRVIGPEALNSIPGGSVFIPSSVCYISSDALSDSVKTIYGVSSSAAEQFALETGRSFILVDITNLRLIRGEHTISVSGHIFYVEGQADSILGNLVYSYQLFSGNEMVAESDFSSGPAAFTLDREGDYDLVLIADSGYDHKTLRIESAVKIVSDIRFSQDEFYLEAGETIPVLAHDEHRAITLSEQENAVYSVNGTTITGCREGTSQIAAEYVYENGWTLTRSAEVHVVKPVRCVSIQSEVPVLYPGESYRISASLDPIDAFYKDITWTSSDETILLIDEDGSITAVSPGTASIRATARNGMFSEIAVICAQHAEEIILNDPLVIEVGEHKPLQFHLIPDNSFESSIEWFTDNESVAVVNDGVIHGVSSGECILTAATDTGITSGVRVIVHQPVTEIYLSESSVTSEIYTPFKLSAAVYPEDAYDASIVWSSSDDTIATVDAFGSVYGLRGGQVLITAAASSGIHSDCLVTITEIKPTSVTFNRSYYCLQIGTEQPVCVDLKPYEAQNQNLYYISSDPEIFTVDDKGMLHAVAQGRATLTCISQSDPDVFDICTVNVISDIGLPLEGITIGINPGHQSKAIMRTYPVAPGSSTMKPGCKAGAQGVNSRRPEYEVNLDVSLKLCQLLIEGGADVVMTRTTNDAYLTNIERAEILNSAHVDMAIQVHCDGSESSSPQGMSAYYRSTGSYVDESKQFADVLLSTMVSDTGAVNHGLHINNEYMSLNYSETPAILIELGYLSNPTEDRLLNSEEYQMQLAQAMYDAICLYYAR